MRCRDALLITLLTLLLGSPAAASCVKSVRWAEDPPFDMLDAQGRLHGITADLMREALQRMGCTVRFVELPWARGLHNLEKGSLDILSGALPTAERARFAHFSVPIIRSPNVLFLGTAVAGKYPLHSLRDLIGTDFRLGAQIDVVYSQEYQALLQEPAFRERLVMVSSREGAWNMIKAGRLDGMIADEITGVIEIEKLGLGAHVQRSELVVSDEPAVVALSRKSVSPAFVERFDSTLNGMLRDGTYVRILQQYLPCQVSAEQLGCGVPSAQ
ncbi:substrate-binding periplasmic protein [Pseudomonas sp. N040]|uniref:substrate-binding periplasmic protein n=1 Tax=Pseudomonas sp. N040 TaxID=2785325 RepID=UPI0018A2ACB3|nr:transporter substrate-binding domain-containing protein [Pseudomonas sp. N040]MBF7731253.1 amino acid ABC transporter substrate-binding protein [Pseudomonas sp. N040]MBW7014896.1 transporter substrate-binding domain-containing protein [Pseudomonas sp. N040]